MCRKFDWIWSKPSLDLKFDSASIQYKHYTATVSAKENETKVVFKLLYFKFKLTWRLLSVHQRVTKKSRLFVLTNSALVYERYITEKETELKRCGMYSCAQINFDDLTTESISLQEMKQGQCICPLSWSVHCNFTGDGKCNKRGWACTPHPHPHQSRLILPSWLNVRKKADVTTLCTLWI